MTSFRTRTEDVLREMRTAVVPVEDRDTVDARRARTVARLRELQVRAGTRREVEVSYRKRLLIAAVVIFSSAGALAAALESWDAVHRPGAAAHTEAIAKGRPSDASTASRNSLPRALTETADARLPLATETTRPSTPARPSKMRERTPARSTLAAENALMQSALSAGREGDDGRAAALLETLLTRYPESPLAQSAEVERFRALKRLGDLTRASEEARRYLGEHPEGMAEDEARRLAVEPRSSPRTGPASR